jgi:uncharacterized damage-inducible protein DinB
MPFSKTLLPEFDEEMKNTRKLLECVPDDKFDYQPHPKSMNLARLASHVAEMPSWTVFTLDQDVLDMQPGEQPHFAKSRAELLEMFDKGVADARKRIQGASDEHWEKTWTFKYAGKPILSNPRSTVMRSVIMNHLVHHRAQLGVYLRLNNVAIPGMYGPSADEPNLFATQAA